MKTGKCRYDAFDDYAYLLYIYYMGMWHLFAMFYNALQIQQCSSKTVQYSTTVLLQYSATQHSYSNLPSGSSVNV